MYNIEIVLFGVSIIKINRPREPEASNRIILDMIYQLNNSLKESITQELFWIKIKPEPFRIHHLNEGYIVINKVL